MGVPNPEDVFDFIDRSHDVLTVAELNWEFRRLVERWGFDYWGSVQVSAGPDAIKAPLTRMFGEVNEAWVARYLEAHHIAYDTAAQEVMRRTKPFWWHEIQQSPHTQRQKRVYDEAADFGLNKGLAIPVRFPDGSVWSVALVGREVYEGPHLKELAFLAAQYYAGRGLLLTERARRRAPLASRLTKRQREIVELLRFGHTQADIARVLAISESTVNNLVLDAKERLAATTVAQLVAESLVLGEISNGAAAWRDRAN